MNFIYWPNPSLYVPSAEVVEPPDPALLADMAKLMLSKSGLGLAAVQVGVFRRIVCVQSGAQSHRFFINPQLSGVGTPELMSEGCLSLPGVYEKVWRYPAIQCVWQDEDLVPCQDSFTGQIAHVLQHEVEHLDGKMFIDSLSPTVRARILAKYRR